MATIVPSKIAVVFDCDDTLAPDTTTWLLEKFGISPSEFWTAASRRVEDGWDPSLAYMTMVLDEVARPNGHFASLTRDRLHELAPEVPFFPGVPDFLPRLRDLIERDRAYRDAGVQVEFFVISGGMEDLLEHTSLREHLRDLWACAFQFGDAGRPVGVKRTVSFTEKTRYLFQISKGLVGPEFRQNPYAVNRPADGPRPIPISNMIYLGDGPSDIPCMSVLGQYGGYVIGVLCNEVPDRAYALGYGRRAHVTVPPDFREAGFAFRQLHLAATRIADRIVQARAGGGTPPWTR